MKRMWVLFLARNYEFFRDRAGFGWNILFPFLIVAGFGLLFGADSGQEFKAGVFPVSGPANSAPAWMESLDIPEKLKTYSFVKLIPFDSRETAMDRLVHHKVDILLKNGGRAVQYWISDSSPRGRLMEKVVKEAMVPESQFAGKVIRQEIQGDQVRYIDWLFPGILGMNIMFSAFFGVGYVIVRYRRSGVLKRLKATPVTSFEYLTAQLLSRVVILMGSSALVWAGCDLIFSFQVRGSYLDAFLVFLAGTLCLVSFGLILASRGTNEELTSGVINFICWPMMFLSEVWFSIEGSSDWIKTISSFLPLTHFLKAARRVINDGADLSQVSHELFLMILMSLVFLSLGSWMFSWTK
ncbi:ABC transporter permease [Desulfospira joergensenii]|uniref:ABC transporter permease n=1 Tax=Desulfospira joergensenii TaxID=53329 RepID=UPI001FC95468|nr:ABC transporter permease [Desulfospira joergensenii]